MNISIIQQYSYNINIGFVYQIKTIAVVSSCKLRRIFPGDNACNADKLISDACAAFVNACFTNNSAISDGDN